MGKIYASKDSQISASEQAHMELSRKLAGECPVLLKNDGVLPMKAGRIALYGRGVRQTIKGGTGSGDVNTRFSVTVEEGLLKGGFEILTKDWLDRNTDHYSQKKKEYTEELEARAKEIGVPAFLLAFGTPFIERRRCGPEERTRRLPFPHGRTG